MTPKPKDQTNFETTCPTCGGKAIGCGDKIVCDACNRMAKLKEICPEAEKLQGLYLMIKKAPNPNAHRELMRRFEEKAYQYFSIITTKLIEQALEIEMLRKLPHVFVGCDVCKAKIKKELEAIDVFLAMAKET